MNIGTDGELRDRLPNECWTHIISFLPRISRQSLSFLHGFEALVEDTSQLEDRRLYQALKNGNLRWSKETSGKTMQARLRHGTINFLDQLIIFGGSSGYGISGTYNDVWRFDFVNRFQRMSTSGSEIPTPRANFAFVRAGDKIFAVGGRSSNFDPFLAHLNPFEVYMLNPKVGSWQKVITTGSEPQHSIGARAAMLSPKLYLNESTLQPELIVVTGLIPMIHNWMQESIPEGNFEHLRASMQVSILKFSDSSMERGTWFRIAEWHHNRRGMPPPRAEFHLVSLEDDNVLMIGGCSTNQVIQDAWVMKIKRNPTYSLKFTQVTISNPFIPALPLHLFPSCIVGDICVFTGVRTILKKPGMEKPKEEPKKVQENSSANSASSSQQFERRTPIFINLERPINTIGAMAAFSVSSQPTVPPQKVLKIQVSPEPSPEPPRRRQDFPMRVFCLDLKGIINGADRPNPTINWLQMKNAGVFPGAPEFRAHGTFTQFDNGLALIGGVRRAQTDDDNLFTQATNEVYMLDYVHENPT